MRHQGGFADPDISCHCDKFFHSLHDPIYSIGSRKATERPCSSSMTSSRWWPGRKAATSIRRRQFSQAGLIRQEVGQAVGRVVEEVAVEDRRPRRPGRSPAGRCWIPPDPGRNACQRRAPGPAPMPCPVKLDQGAGVVDIAVADADAQVGVGGAPAPGPDADESSRPSRAAFSRPMARPSSDARCLGGQGEIALRWDENHVADVAHPCPGAPCAGWRR